MTARTTYEAAVKSAGAAKIATLSANETTKQTTIDAALSVAGYNLQAGSYATLAAATKNAAQAKRDADFAAEQTKQAAIAAARDALRDSGDRAPV